MQLLLESHAWLNERCPITVSLYSFEVDGTKYWRVASRRGMSTHAYEAKEYTDPRSAAAAWLDKLTQHELPELISNKKQQ